MTRKDYIKIAKAIKEADASLSYASVNMGEKDRAVQIIAYTIGEALRADNARFDQARFLTACGVK